MNDISIGPGIGIIGIPLISIGGIGPGIGTTIGIGTKVINGIGTKVETETGHPPRPVSPGTW